MKAGRLIAALVLAAIPGLVMAQAGTQSTPRIDQRQDNQQKRIERGAATGNLTTKEAARLEKGQARIQKQENRAMADGKVTPKEAKRIEKAQDKENKKIERATHNKKHN
jgi:hypothetical protein